MVITYYLILLSIYQYKIKKIKIVKKNIKNKNKKNIKIVTKKNHQK